MLLLRIYYVETQLNNCLWLLVNTSNVFTTWPGLEPATGRAWITATQVARALTTRPPACFLYCLKMQFNQNLWGYWVCFFPNGVNLPKQNKLGPVKKKGVFYTQGNFGVNLWGGRSICKKKRIFIIDFLPYTSPAPKGSPQNFPS